MTCHHGTSLIVPHPAAFASDEELRTWLGLPDTPQGRTLLARVTPEERQEHARLCAVARELEARRIPRGVIACDRRLRR